MVGPYDKSQNLTQKRELAEKAVQMVEDNTIIGLGSGSTMQIFVDLIAERIKREQLQLHFVPASKRIESYAMHHRLNISNIEDTALLDISFDGADRIDARHNLIKGGGGSLFRERQVLEKSQKKVIIADESKFVEEFANEVIPVEIVPYNFKWTIEKIIKLGFHVAIRKIGNEYFITDNNNYIVDIKKEKPFDVKITYQELKIISGIVDVGLFIENSFIVKK
ncbi:ribose 5-phosphate isomerase A [Solibacillus sp. FSL W7-1324]|uniref:ribose 5-phosphate isomerase A n=1 Tax=Solibacillus sp. FSL W7-1324 TaxID=2921701 RepID=UPI0030FC3A41